MEGLARMIHVNRHGLVGWLPQSVGYWEMCMYSAQSIRKIASPNQTPDCCVLNVCPSMYSHKLKIRLFFLRELLVLRSIHQSIQILDTRLSDLNLGNPTTSR
jgi:hypothetical protein